MTLLHFDLRKPVRRTSFRTHFLQNSKNFLTSNEIYTESFILIKFDDKFLNCWNWFINSRIMTLLQFDLKKSSELIFYKIKNFLNKQQNLHKKLSFDEI